MTPITWFVALGLPWRADFDQFFAQLGKKASISRRGYIVLFVQMVFGKKNEF